MLESTLEKETVVSFLQKMKGDDSLVSRFDSFLNSHVEFVGVQNQLKSTKEKAASAGQEKK